VKVECPLCAELVELRRFRASPGGIEVDCAACGDSYAVATDGELRPVAADRPEPAVAPDAGEMRCPKCEELQPEAEACRACGLAADRFEAYASEADDAAGPELDELWAACADDWHDDAAHDRFIEAASVAGMYAYAARRYRGHARDNPGDSRAEAALARLRRMAEATLLSAAAARQPEAGKEPYRGVVLLMITLVLLAGIGGVYMLFRGASSPDQPGVDQPATPVPLDQRRHRVTPRPSRSP
jgi:hypothetical protein